MMRSRCPAAPRFLARRLLPALAALSCLLAAGPAAAALDADVVLVYGSSWRRALPAYAAAAQPVKKGAVGTARLPPVILWSGGEERWTEDLLRRLAPRKVVVIGPPGTSAAPLRIPGKVKRIEAPDERLGLALAKVAFGKAAHPPAVYVADGTGLAPALAATALASAAQAPLLIASGDLEAAVRDAGELARRLDAKEVVVVGAGDEAALSAASGCKVRVLSGDEALRAYDEDAAASHHLVLAAPADAEGPFAPTKLSVGMLPYALAKGAALAWVGAGPGGGRNPEEVAHGLEEAGRGPFDVVTIVGDQVAIPMQKMEDIDQRKKKHPRIHKIPWFVSTDGRIEGRSVGRLAALDVYDLSRWIARIVHGVQGPSGQDGALVFANADKKFILGETISRTTSAELANAGVRVESYYRDAITPKLIREELPGHGLVLWEGHPRDLTLDDDALPLPAIELPPATFFLQGCYTLDRSDPYLLIERGANAVLGTYMAVYSSSGSSFARAYISAQLHEGATAGEALASARNYLLATVELKKRRGHSDWRKTLRAALSFDLWGDPTAKLPVRRGRLRKRAVTASLRGSTIKVNVPRGRLPTAAAGAYVANIRPAAQLSALYRHRKDDPTRTLVELYFVEVEVPEKFGDHPQVTAAYPDEAYAWVFSPRTRKLSLLIHEKALGKRRKRGGTLHFHLKRGD